VLKLQFTCLVSPANQPPVAINDINATLVNTPVFINVLTNDYDPDGDPITVNSLLISNPVNGSLINGSTNGHVHVHAQYRLRMVKIALYM
jgi:hypothetical protein